MLDSRTLRDKPRPDLDASPDRIGRQDVHRQRDDIVKRLMIDELASNNRRRGDVQQLAQLWSADRDVLVTVSQLR